MLLIHVSRSLQQRNRLLEKLRSDRMDAQIDDSKSSFSVAQDADRFALNFLRFSYYHEIGMQMLEPMDICSIRSCLSPQSQFF
mmetsp:Transcript_28539/g.111750  ORF Transcript_28539/g.111750 Transcript_28539/m.111750 type:complete len:83 (-) Transcript_28539:3422-3670(-)